MRRRYITKNALLEKGEREKQKEKEGRQLQFLPPLKAFAAKHQRTEKKKNQSSDKPRG